VLVALNLQRSFVCGKKGTDYLKSTAIDRKSSPEMHERMRLNVVAVDQLTRFCFVFGS
jgi:hypothetical protein